MFNNPSPLVYSNNNFRYNDNRYNQWSNQNPQEVELMMKQKFQQPMGQNSMQPQNYQLDPYLELQNELTNCSITVRNKIINDKEYKACDNECELLLKQTIEEVFIPQILNTPKGRIIMENFVGVVKQLKEKYSQEEAKTNEQLQTLLNDEVVQNRMRQLSEMNLNSKEDFKSLKGDKNVK